jgi:hypothetical protein
MIIYKIAFMFILFLNHSNRINFDDPSTVRSGALAKSAVLAALEEEEREKAGQKPGELMGSKSSSKVLLVERKKNPFANEFLLKLPDAYSLL